MTEPEKTEEKVSVNAVTKLLSAMGFGNVLTKGEALKTHERGDDNDFRQIVADLISSDKSPFVPDDEYGLRDMSYNTLKTLRDDYLGGAIINNSEKGDLAVVDPKKEVKTNAEDGLPQTKAELQELVANSVAEALKSHQPTLSGDQQAALDRALKLNEDHKAQLIAKVVANSDITEEAAKAMDISTLEVVANGLRAPADYGGRSTPVINTEENDVVVNAMLPRSTKKASADEKKVHGL